MSSLKKVKIWFAKYWKWFAATLSVIGSLFVLFFLRDDLKSFLIQKKRISIKKRQREIKLLEHKKAQIQMRINYTEDQIDEVDKAVSEINKSIEKEKMEIGALATNRKLDKFDEMGY